MSKHSAPKTSRRPRRPEPFFRSQTRSWYVQFGGRQIPLGRDRKLAWAKYDELIAVSNFNFFHEPVVKLLDAYLEHVHANRAGATYLWYRHYLRNFVQSVGRTIRVADLKTHHASQWLDTSVSPPLKTPVR